MKIKVCTWKTCMDKFSNYIIDRLNNDKKKFNLNHIDIEESKCMWHCKKWPNIKIDKNIHNYCNPLKASKIILNTKKKKK
jgi:NADH:ubiquinone oxidoreductase subunit E